MDKLFITLEDIKSHPSKEVAIRERPLTLTFLTITKTNKSQELEIFKYGSMYDKTLFNIRRKTWPQINYT